MSKKRRNRGPAVNKPFIYNRNQEVERRYSNDLYKRHINLRNESFSKITGNIEDANVIELYMLSILGSEKISVDLEEKVAFCLSVGLLSEISFRKWIDEMSLDKRFEYAKEEAFKLAKDEPKENTMGLLGYSIIHISLFLGKVLMEKMVREHQ